MFLLITNIYILKVRAYFQLCINPTVVSLHNKNYVDYILNVNLNFGLFL